ncbi:DNA-binding WRKY [Cynara cardunculus var. scolymus]|uniref:DNA-binding WRKY n=1 Tax=Cynara cardunculus var. scolymus TaxID=59895 RepID=A0A118JW55_CYNCS|nr:DNA-binding WRKY [Cynara cardunculus var. scolymus]
MEELEPCYWSQGFQDDLLCHLLNDDSPFLFVTPEISSDANSINNFISSIYSGPTITDIETALLASDNTTPDLSSLARISEMESRVENKYILKIKNSGNVMADDGYKWRKSYYKCTNPRCGAKKQVERSNEDPDTLIITYEGLHLHYMYPLFVFGQSENPDPPTKKFRRFNLESHKRPTEDTDKNEPSTMLRDHQKESSEVVFSPQGLLEDMVPLLIRNPIIYTTNSSNSSSSSSSHHPSPPTSPSFSWSPKY